MGEKAHMRCYVTCCRQFLKILIIENKFIISICIWSWFANNALCEESLNNYSKNEKLLSFIFHKIEQHRSLGTPRHPHNAAYTCKNPNSVSMKLKY